MPQPGERETLRRHLAALLRMEGAITHRLRAVQCEAKAVQKELRQVELREAEYRAMAKRGLISQHDKRIA